MRHAQAVTVFMLLHPFPFSLALLPSDTIMWLKAVYMTHTTEPQILPLTTYEVTSHLVNHMFWLAAAVTHAGTLSKLVHFARARTLAFLGVIQLRSLQLLFRKQEAFFWKPISKLLAISTWQL